MTSGGLRHHGVQMAFQDGQGFVALRATGVAPMRLLPYFFSAKTIRERISPGQIPVNAAKPKKASGR